MHLDQAEARPIAFHVNTSLAGKRVMATDVARLRTAARVILEHGVAAKQIAFRISDTHLHWLLLCSRAEAGEFSRRVGAALHWRLALDVPFRPAEYTPIRTQSHLAAAFWYILRQEGHHGTAFDPLHEGSSLPDTLGLRAVDTLLRERVASALPRVRQEPLAGLLATHTAAPIDAAELPLALGCLSDAAGAAFAIADLAAGQSTQHVRARQVAIEVALQHRARWSPRQGAACTRALSVALGLSQRRCQTLLAARPGAEPCAAPGCAAVLGQWRLRSHRHAMLPTASPS
jgi:hypothetical protein